MATLLKKRGGKMLSEDEIMLKFVQICLGLMHVHNKVRPAHPASGVIQTTCAITECCFLRLCGCR